MTAPAVPDDQAIIHPRRCAIGWWLVLAAFPAFFFWFLPRFERTSGSNDPYILAATWGGVVIAVRAVWAIVRCDRSWWWIGYLALYFVLIFIAEYAVEVLFYSPNGSSGPLGRRLQGD